MGREYVYYFFPDKKHFVVETLWGRGIVCERRHFVRKKTDFQPNSLRQRDSIPLCQETVLETLGRETFCRKMFVGKSIV